MPVKKREDVHSPKNLVPKDYEYVTCFYSARRADEEGLNKKNAEILQNHMKKTGGKFSDHWHGGTCAVCGAAAANVAVFYHKPSNTYIYTGSECADKISDQAARKLQQFIYRRREEKQRKSRIEKAKEYLQKRGLEAAWDVYEKRQAGDPNPSLQTFAAYTIMDILNRLIRDGKITEKQEDFLRKLVTQFRGYSSDDNRKKVQEYLKQRGLELAWEVFQKAEADADFSENSTVAIIKDLVMKLLGNEKLSDKQENFLKSMVEKYKFEFLQDSSQIVPEGEQKITGEVVSIKIDRNQWGGYSSKMLVKADAGWKVWGTIPSNLMDIPEFNRGSRVSFVATVTRSKDDPTFGFFSRPKNAKMLS
jgi:hypothetical protein